MGAATVTIAVDTLTDCLRARAGCSLHVSLFFVTFLFVYKFFTF